MNKEQILHLIASRIDDLLHQEGTAREVITELSHILRQATNEPRRGEEVPSYSSGLTYVNPGTYTVDTPNVMSGITNASNNRN